MVVVPRCRDDPAVVVVVWGKLYDVSDGVETPVDVQADGAFVQTFNKTMGRHAANLNTINTLSAVKTNECEATNATVL